LVTAFAIVADGFDWTSFHGFLRLRSRRKHINKGIPYRTDATK
jgi:hypothetical protein